ncbi:MAG: CCA tRNA nucleotidyltransferase [Clostridia bacterium]|nr:CCA tRNA nucleotidyltransferase [Clostridia bacterium]
MEINVPKPLIKLSKALGAPIYIVGGYVRNALASLPPSDIDICGPFLLDESNLPEGFKIISVYKRMGTCLIKSVEDPSVIMEYTAFRREEYQPGGGHTPIKVEFVTDISEDVLRRDFTANSIYYDVANSRLIDPLGGVEDVKNRRLRAHEARKVFGSDGLRLMRLARIAAETGFDIDKETFEIAKESCSLLEDITPNRKYEELDKILHADLKYGVKDAHFRGLMLLKEMNLLKFIIPELNDLDSLAQPIYHKYDALMHTFMTVKEASPRLRLAALLHDIGKAKVFKETGKFHGHDKEGAEITKRLLGKDMFNLPLKEATRVVELVRLHMYDGDGKTRSGKMRLFVAKNSAIVYDLQELMRADAVATGFNPSKKIRLIDFYEQLVKEKAPLRYTDLKISGSELISIGYQGAEIKEELDALLRDCILNPNLNKRKKLKELSLKAYCTKRNNQL